jgi:hypothetical protein
VLGSSIHLKISKKNKDEEFWPRLLVDKNLEKTNVKIDWDRYVDEDEAEGNDFDTQALDGGMDFNSMMGGGGMGGMGGMGGLGGMGGMGGMGGLGGMGGMGGMGGFGGMGNDEGEEEDGDEVEGEDGDDEEDNELPDLEPTEAHESS